jgi:hypothetical protein
MRIMARVLVGVAAVCLAGLAGGCEHFNVIVMLDKDDPGLKDAKGTLNSIEVNIVGVNQIEFPVWEQMSVTKYWEPGNRTRESAVKYVMTFGANAPDEQLLKIDDPIWKKWDERNAEYLFVLAFLPGEDKPGLADPRRIFLPYKTSKWESRYWGKDTIKIQLKSGGLTSLRQPNK